MDLAIILEPIYWPGIVGRRRTPLGENRYRELLESYRSKVSGLILNLDTSRWREIHSGLRYVAAWLDDNNELYLLLRLSAWESREKLKGRISGALWIRHMAEVIRRGFEKVHKVEWPEEDQAFGHWWPGARIRLFGSDRPLDDTLRSKPFIAHSFGLFTGSTIRWYVEGETEYYAIRYILEEPARSGIELVNLRGEIAKDQGSAARKLQDALLEDMSLRRFSIISFDQDWPPNVRAIRAQIEQGHIIGLINANDPDFEFANFSLDELVEVAARLDDQSEFDGSKLRTSDWTGIRTSKAFDEIYAKHSDRKRSVKGQQWGEALASYAMENTRHPLTGKRRPILQTLSSAFWAWSYSYIRQKERFTFNSNTFAPKER